MTIGDLLREARIERKLLAKELARASGVTVQFVSNVERGTNKPPVDYLRAVIPMLRVSRASVIRTMVRGYRDQLRKELR